MEFTGSEQRIQALFHELKATDEQLAPRFASVWQRAQAGRAEVRPSIHLSFAGAGFFVSALCLVLFWSQGWRRPEPKFANPIASADNQSRLQVSDTALQQNDLPKQTVAKRGLRRVAAQRRARLLTHQIILKDAMAFVAWRSPTEILMESPAEDVFSTLPQLTQAADELNSFLPRTELEENQ